MCWNSQRSQENERQFDRLCRVTRLTHPPWAYANKKRKLSIGGLVHIAPPPCRVNVANRTTKIYLKVIGYSIGANEIFNEEKICYNLYILYRLNKPLGKNRLYSSVHVCRLLSAWSLQSCIQSWHHNIFIPRFVLYNVTYIIFIRRTKKECWLAYLLSDYKREYGMPSTRPGEGEDDEDSDDLPSSGALSLAPTSGPEVVFSLFLLLLSHVLVPALARRWLPEQQQLPMSFFHIGILSQVNERAVAVAVVAKDDDKPKDAAMTDHSAALRVNNAWACPVAHAKLLRGLARAAVRAGLKNKLNRRCVYKYDLYIYITYIAYVCCV